MRTLLQWLFPRRAEKLRARLNEIEELMREARARLAEAEERCRSATGYWRVHWQNRRIDSERAVRYCGREAGRLAWQLAVFA